MSKAYLILSPHQDDELLSLGIPAVHAIGEGYETFIALITDGRASRVREQLRLSAEEFIAARDEEFRASCLALGYCESNIFIRKDGGRICDGQLSVPAAIEQIQYFISSLPDRFDELVVATISPFGTETQHQDHKALGEAALALFQNSSEREALGIDRLDLFLEPYEFEKLSNTRNVRRLEIEDLAPIERAADSYKNSAHGIAFLSVPRELGDFLGSPVAFQDCRTAHQAEGGIKQVLRNRLVMAAKVALRPVDAALSYLKCKRVVFKPEMLVDPQYTVCVDYIYNRPDLFTANCEAFEVVFDGRKYLIQVLYEGDHAELCIRLSNVPQQVALILCDCVFRRHSEVRYIRMMHVQFQVGHSSQSNHIKVVFPDTVDELNARLSSHTRSEIRRKHRRLIAEHGETRFAEFGRDDITDEIVDAFFNFKMKTHGREYGMTPKEYLDYYHVTHAYVLFLENVIIGVWFSCEQCSTVNAENFSYDDFYSWYSPGILVHQYALECLVKKGKKQIFLGDGHQGQKLMFGSVDEVTWNCTVYRDERRSEASLPFARMAAAGMRRRAGDVLTRAKRQKSSVEPYRELFFSTNTAPEKLPPLFVEGTRFFTMHTAEEIEEFASSHATTLDKLLVFRDSDNDLDEQMRGLKDKILTRFALGSTFSVLCSENRCLSSGWLAVGQDFCISEISVNINMGESSCGILYDFMTEPEARGQGLYPRLLGEMMREAVQERGCDAFVIYTSEDNFPSSRGIQKAGFKYDGAFTREDAIPYLKQFGFTVIVE